MYVGIAGSASGMSAAAATEDYRYLGHCDCPGEGIVWNLLQTKKERVLSLLRVLDALAGEIDESVSGGEFRDRITQLAVGISGIDQRYDCASVQEALATIKVSADILVSCIPEVSYCGAMQMKPGILIRSGTGAAVFGIDGSGKTHLANAWDPVVGDQGSAYDIGRQLLVAAGRYADGRCVSTESESLALCLAESARCASIVELHQELLDTLELYGPFNHTKRIADLNRVAFDLEADGCAQASRIVTEAAKSLAEGVRAVYGHLEFSPPASVPVVLAGGVLRNEPRLRELIANELSSLGNEFGVSFEIQQGKFSPAIGALLFACAGQREAPPSDTLDVLASSLPARGESPELYYCITR